MRQFEKYRFAETTVKTSVTNNDDKAREAEIDLLIPIDAFVMKFTMEIGGKIIEGKVEEKQKAKKIFDKVSKIYVLVVLFIFYVVFE